MRTRMKTRMIHNCLRSDLRMIIQEYTYHLKKADFPGSFPLLLPIPIVYNSVRTIY